MKMNRLLIKYHENDVFSPRIMLDPKGDKGMQKLKETCRKRKKNATK